MFANEKSERYYNEKGEIVKGKLPAANAEAATNLLNYAGYQVGSAADFTENLSTDEPDETLDSRGVYLLNWELVSPKPYISDNVTERTQIFSITGLGEQEGHYAWLVANREDFGAVGKIINTYYEITATAIHPENSVATATIVVEATFGGGNTYITSRQIAN